MLKKSAKETAPNRLRPAKLEALSDDNLAQVIAWLFLGDTYSQIVDRVKERFGVTCSVMAVRCIWLRYAPRAEEMRQERVVRLARVLMQEPRS